MYSRKKAFLVICFSFILILSLTSCKKSTSVSEAALSYYKLFIKQDPTSAISIGMSEETAQQILDNMHENLKLQITETLSMDNRITLTSEQINLVEAAYLEALKSLDASASSTETDDGYNVTITSSYIDFNTINKTAINAALNEVDVMDYLDEIAYFTDVTSAYITHVVDEYQKATPESDTQEATFIFTKQNNLWLPEDYSDFVSGLYAITSKNPSIL